MKNNIIRYIIGLCSVFCTLYSYAQNELDRSVTVERDFQPVIQSAGKINTQPAVVETTIEPVSVEYSEFTTDVTPAITLSPILSQPTRFAEGKPFHGYVRGALGHINTLFDFGYRLDDKKKSILDVYAHHRAEWGLKTLSKSKIGFTFTHQFSNCDLYFGVNGGNVFYYKYGHFFDYALAPTDTWVKDKVAYPTRNFTDRDKTNLWTAEAFIGVKSNPKQAVQYKFQTGYALFAKPNAVVEHQVRTSAAFDWHRDAHHVGANIYLQNNMLQLSGNLATAIPDSLYRDRHALRMEPYYAYNGRRINIHVGVNFDLNIGKGQNALSATKNITFAPSPHIRLEAQIAKKWLTLYADVMGRYGLGSLQGFMEYNRYRLIHAGITSNGAAVYTPVDAELGFHIRPYRDLLIELHGGYALSYYDVTIIGVTDSVNTVFNKTQTKMLQGDFAYADSHYGRGKVGAQINYHYRDIVRIHLYGDYYFWSVLAHKPVPYTFANPCAELAAFQAGTNKTVYDRANWEAGLRIDGKIDKHWSLYSDNHFAGSRVALATDGEHILKPTVQLNLGLQYEMWVGKAKANANGQTLRPEPQPNLTLFFQLNNWLHYKNDIYYGYQSEGINFLLGATYRF